MSDETLSDFDDEVQSESAHHYDVAEVVDDYLPAAKESIRLQLRNDIEEFLAKGGAIHEIAPNIVADPPRKPQSNYGGQPI